MRRRMYAAGLGLLVGIAMSGCAQERSPINRVQPDALKKSFFLGEDLKESSDDPVFWTRGYNVMNSFDQNAWLIGTASGVDRIRWEVTENQLIARKAYQLFPGRDNKGVVGAPTANGTVVAAYKILSHFDVKRAYNPGTGEDENVIDENTSDRPWYSRQYFRVDWSTNEVADPMDLDKLFGRWFGDPKVTPMSYYVNDPTSEDAPFFDEKDGYFEVTNRFWVEPGKYYFDWGTFPACAIIGLTLGTAIHDCNAQEAHIRQAFWRIPADHDFEPQENITAYQDVINNFGGAGDGLLIQYGAPIQEYDPAYGFIDDGLHILTHKHNIWLKSHANIPCDSNKDDDKDGIADQCSSYEGSKGSQCDIFNSKCTIPYRDRTVKPIGWFLNKEMPLEYQDSVNDSGDRTEAGAIEDVAESWNQLFMAAVGMARVVECRRTGDGNRNECYNQYFNSAKVMVRYGNWLIDDPIDHSPVQVICHNPVRKYDNPICGKEGYKARIGDMRKMWVMDYPEATNCPFGGVTNLNPDPLTGEAIGNTSISVHISTRAQRFIDTVLLEMNELSMDEFLAGGSPEKFGKILSTKLPGKALTKEEMKRRVESVDSTNLATTGGLLPAGQGTHQDKLKGYYRSKLELSNDTSLLQAAALQSDQARASLRNSGLEKDLIDSHWLASLNIDPTTAVTGDVLELASPLRNLDSAKLAFMRQFMQKRLADAGYSWVGEAGGMGVGQINNAPLANYFKAKYGGIADRTERIAAITKEIRKESFMGVIIHEMGHAMGQRHQFASSWDSPNYFPQYWQLRTADGNADAMKSCEGNPRDGETDSCLGPRYLDPHTTDERGWVDHGMDTHAALEYFGNTSTMEYQSENFSETSGVGTWDYHMTKAVYGNVLETIDPDVIPKDQQEGFSLRMISHILESDLVLENGSITGMHYTRLARAQKTFDLNRDCRNASEEEKTIGKWRVVHGKVCQPTPRDNAAWQDFRSDMNEAANQLGWGTPALLWHTRSDLKASGDAKNQVRWFYRIGENYSPSYIHTNMMDEGADEYEIAVNAIAEFDAAYPFRYFRRGNKDFSTNAIPSIASERLFDVLRSYHWSTANTILRYQSFYGDVGWQSAAQDDDNLRPAAMGNAEIFKALMRYTLTPQPGDFQARADGLYDAVPGVSNNADFTVKIIDGRYIDEAYNNGPTGGGSWDFERWWTRAGFSMEKAYSFLALCDSRPTLSTVSRDNYLDGRGVKLNFRSDMPQAFDRLLGSILAEDWASIAPYIPDGSSGEVKPLMIDIENTKNPPSRTPNAKLLFPNVGYQQQLLSAIFSALYARENTDMTLIHKMRIWVDGMEGDISKAAFPKPEDQLKFYDPGSGFTYIGRRFGNETIDGRQVERGIGSRMLQRANQLVIESYQVERDANNDPILDTTGKPTLTLDTNNQPIPLDAAVSKRGELLRYVGLIDAIRQVGMILGQGPY